MVEAVALQQKRKVRTGHRGSASRMQGQVATMLGTSALDLSKLAMLKLTLEEKLKTLKELDPETVKLVSEDDLETEIQQTDECQKKIFEGLAQIKRVLTLPNNCSYSNFTSSCSNWGQP